MSIDAKHAYRFGYLKSEHWHDLRILKLAGREAACHICKQVSWANDVHHVNYRNLHNVGNHWLLYAARRGTLIYDYQQDYENWLRSSAGD